MIKDRRSLDRIIDMISRGEMIMPGEVSLLREAVDQLDDLARIMEVMNPGASFYRPDDTAALRVISDDDHWGRP